MIAWIAPAVTVADFTGQLWLGAHTIITVGVIAYIYFSGECGR